MLLRVFVMDCSNWHGKVWFVGHLSCSYSIQIHHRKVELLFDTTWWIWRALNAILKIENVNSKNQNRNGMLTSNRERGTCPGRLTYRVHTQLSPFAHNQSEVLSQIQLLGAVPQNYGTVIIRYLT
jgi:hypothetical protein